MREVIEQPEVIEPLEVSGLNESDSAAIIREVQDAFGEDMPACCPSHQRVRYQLLDVAQVRGPLYAVRVLRIPLDQRGKAQPGMTTAPGFMLARAGRQWELVGRRFSV